MKKIMLLNLIKDYQSEVNNFMKIFENQYKRTDLLRAWHEGVIEKEGTLPGGIQYELHGIGCRVYYPNREIEFDFGPNNRFDGFDLWRLKEYLLFRKDIQKILNADDLRLYFDELISEGVISKIYDNSNLFFFVDKDNQ